MADIGAVELAVNYPVITLPATGITVAGATLNATVIPNVEETEWYFEYGTATSYGNFTDAGFLPPGSSAVAVNAPITGLSPGSNYHFRAVVMVGMTTTYGNDLTFVAPLPSTLVVSPDSYQQTFRAYANPFYPPAQTNFTYTLMNLGPGVLDWSLNISSNWLSASVTNGTLVNGASTNVDVYLNDNAYLLGVETFPDSWIGVINFFNQTGLSSNERQIGLQVTPPVNNGGVVLWGASASAPLFLPGLFRVNLGPANAVAGGAAWRAVDEFLETNWLMDTTNWFYPSAPGRTIEFLPVAGYTTPSNHPVLVSPVTPVVITGTYVPLPPIILSDPQQLPNGAFRLTLSSPTGKVYSIQGSTNLVDWSDIQFFTNNTGTNLFTNPPAINSTKGFFRARQRP